MHKIYSRPRIRIPKVLINGEVLNNHKNKKIAKIIYDNDWTLEEYHGSK